MDNLKKIKEILYSSGFNLFGLSSLESYDNNVLANQKILKFYPSQKTIVLFGSGGKYFWDVFKKFQETKEGKLFKNLKDPIDSYTEYCLSKLKIMFPETIQECLYPFKAEKLFIDYQKLAVCTGLGHYSPYIKLVLHPDFGPWISLRGLFLTKEILELTGPLTTPVPCLTCYKPCLRACPVKAVTETNYDFYQCAIYRNLETDCLSSCHVREVCIIGPEHAYSTEEGLHRNKSSMETLRMYYKIAKI